MSNIYTYNPEEFNTGTVKVYNMPKKSKKYKTHRSPRARLVVGLAALLALLSAAGIIKVAFNDSGEVVIPEGKEIFNASYTAQSDDTWRKIAKKFYDDEKGIESFSQYVQQLKNANPEGLHSGHNISVPNIVDSDSNIMKALEQIDLLIAKESIKTAIYETHQGQGFDSVARDITGSDDRRLMDDCISRIKSLNPSCKEYLQLGTITIPTQEFYRLWGEKIALEESLSNYLNNDNVSKSL